MDREALLDALRDFCDRVFEELATTLGPRATRILERTPDHVRCLDLIGDVYPDAYVVHIIRDGRDVVRSLLSQDWGPDDAGEAAMEWRSAIEAARATAPSLVRYREVRYEALLEDPSAALTDLFAWLGLDAGKESMKGILLESGALFNVDPSAPRAEAGKWQQGLPAEALDTVVRVAGETLAGLGYGMEPVGAPPTGIPLTQTSPQTESRRRRRLRATRRTLVDKEALARVTRTQRVANRFLTLVAERNFDRLGEVMEPRAYVRLLGGGLDWTGRGIEGKERLVAALEEDAGLQGRQVRGEVHPAVPTFALVASYESVSGVHDRVFVLTVEGEAVIRVTYYRFPLA